MNISNSVKKPWYKEPYVWFVIFFPSLAIVSGAVMIYLAISSNDGMVVDDYYKKGLEINQTLERDQAAIAHQLEANLHVDKERNLMWLYLKAAPNYTLPNSIQLSFSHRTKAGLDQNVVLQRIANDTYQAVLPTLVEGPWFILLSADDWRILQATQVPLAPETLLKPSLVATNTTPSNTTSPKSH